MDVKLIYRVFGLYILFCAVSIFAAFILYGF